MMNAFDSILILGECCFLQITFTPLIAACFVQMLNSDPSLSKVDDVPVYMVGDTETDFSFS